MRQGIVGQIPSALEGPPLTVSALGTPGILELVAASFQLLPPAIHTFISSPLLLLARTLVVGLESIL